MKSILHNVVILLVASISTLNAAARNTTTLVPTDTIQKKTVAETDTLPVFDTTLDDFVIVQTKKLIQSDGAKLTYNVTEDPEASTNTTLEILRKVPGVTVDAEDNIKINGQSSFKIYLNGREDPMMKGDVKTILKSMPASTIKKIEVISEPGAKYEAEGAGGILNIVTETKQSLAGFLTNINLSINNRGMGGGVYARTKVGNVTADARVNYNNSRMFHIYNTTRYEAENLQDDTNHLQTRDGRGRSGSEFTMANVNLSWEPDTLNLVTFGFNYMGGNWSSPSDMNMRMTDIYGVEQWSMKRQTESINKWNSLSAQLSYQHTFGNPQHFIVASYSFDYSSSINNSVNTTYDVKGDPGLYADTPYIKSVNESRNPGHIIQIDYSNPLSSKHLLEAGAKASFSPNRGNNAPYYGLTEKDAAIDESQHVEPHQFRDIMALYASYTGDFTKWNVRAGLRYEYTHMGINYKLGKYDDFTTILNDLVPNASITYKFDWSSNLRLAYQMRISRPGLSVLNPYRNLTSPGQVSYGNPDLESTKNHNVSLKYSNYKGALSGSFGVRYTYSGNAVSDIIFNKDGLINTTYANVGASNSVAFEVNANWNIIRNLNVSLWMQETWSHYHVDSELLCGTKVNWQTSLNANVNYMMPCKLRLSAYGGFGTPWADLQSKGSTYYYYGIGLSRSFLKDDALTLSVSGANFLPSHFTYTWSQVSESARIYSSNRQPQWNARLGISWKFGKLKADVKRTAANVEMEGSSSGTDKSSQGGGN